MIFVQALILRVKGQEVFIVGEARAQLMTPGPSMVCLVFFWVSRDQLTLGPVSLSPGGPSCLPSGDFLLLLRLRVLLVAFLEHIHTADPAARFSTFPSHALSSQRCPLPSKPLEWQSQMKICVWGSSHRPADCGLKGRWWHPLCILQGGPLLCQCSTLSTVLISGSFTLSPSYTGGRWLPRELEAQAERRVAACPEPTADSSL